MQDHSPLKDVSSVFTALRSSRSTIESIPQIIGLSARVKSLVLTTSPNSGFAFASTFGTHPVDAAVIEVSAVKFVSCPDRDHGVLAYLFYVFGNLAHIFKTQERKY